jgi:hypothetical protein
VSKITEFTVVPGQTEKTFRVEKSVQHLRFVRHSGFSIATLGLLAGLPERVTVEITHPTRRRIQGGQGVSMAHYAAWAQYGRGAIVETFVGNAQDFISFNMGVLPEGSQAVKTEFNIFLNDGGPIELLADDQCMVTVRGLLAGKYEVYNPNQPVIPPNAQEYLSMERALILEDTLSKPLVCAGYQGIILPNDPSAIEAIIIDYNMGEGRTEQSEYTLDELMDAQDDVNPHFSEFHYDAFGIVDDISLLRPAGQADLLVLDFKHITNLEIKSVLGRRVEYTMARVADRNAA